MSERACIECGKTFQAKGRKLLCGKTCKKKRQREQIRNWFRGHDRQMRAYWQRYHLEHLAKRRAANRANYYKRKGAA